MDITTLSPRLAEPRQDNFTAPRGLVTVAFSIGVISVLFFMIQFLLVGLRATDKDITDIFSVFGGAIDLSAVARERHFLIEAVLPNLYGAFLQLIGLSPKLSRLVMVASGFAMLYGAFVFAVYRGHIRLISLINVLAFTAVFKTILVWYGKSDPFLFAFLFLVAVLPPKSKAAAPMAFCAVLCHPTAALLAVLAYSSALFILDRRNALPAILGALIGIFIHVLVMRLFFEGYQSRIEFASAGFWSIVLNGLPHTISFLAVSVLLPLAILLSTAAAPRPSTFDALLLASTIAGAFVVSLYLTFDHSRVFVILTLPMFIVALLRREHELLSLWRDRPALAVALAGLVMGLPYLDGAGWQSFELNIINAIFAGGWI